MPLTILKSDSLGILSNNNHVITSESASFVGCIVQMNTSFNLDTSPAGGATSVSGYYGFDNSVIDTHGFHDTVTNNTRITIPMGLGGKYAFFANYYISNDTAAPIIFTVNWMIDGNYPTDYYFYNTECTLAANEYFASGIFVVIDLLESQYVELMATLYNDERQASTSALVGCYYIGS